MYHVTVGREGGGDAWWVVGREGRQLQHSSHVLLRLLFPYITSSCFTSPYLSSSLPLHPSSSFPTSPPHTLPLRTSSPHSFSFSFPFYANLFFVSSHPVYRLLCRFLYLTRLTLFVATFPLASFAFHSSSPLCHVSSITSPLTIPPSILLQLPILLPPPPVHSTSLQTLLPPTL